MNDHEEDEWVWKGSNPTSAHLISYIDNGVLRKLPQGTRVLSIVPSGRSYWARTAKIEALDESGDRSDFFIKVLQGDHGKHVVSGEFQAMSSLHQIMPELVAEPVGWGKYADNLDTYFFVARFHELSGKLPAPADFAKALAEMHRRSVGGSEKFGSDSVTYGGRSPVVFPISDTWEACFGRSLALKFQLEEDTQGSNPSLLTLRDAILYEVLPRLLRPLESEGRRLVPHLIHGDMWDGNVSVDIHTGLPVIFDATPVWAHNEYELAPMVIPRHRMTGQYIEEYVKHMGVSEPSEDFHDRLLLYSICFNLHASSLYPDELLFRHTAMDTMRYLCNKYSGGQDRVTMTERLAGSADMRWKPAASHMSSAGPSRAGLTSYSTGKMDEREI